METGTSDICNFDSVAHEYDETRYLPPEAQAQAARLLYEVMAFVPGQAMLDSGVGTGRFALPLARLGVPVIGVDISRQMMARLLSKRAALEQAGEALPLRLARGDLRRLPIATASVGAVLIVHILHLIVEWQTVLQEVRRVLTPGGALVMASESGAQRWMPTRQHYFEQAQQRGLLRAHQGATSWEDVRAYLESTGAQVARVDAERIHWTTPVRVADTLERLRRRTWSNIWAVPDADHAELMAETEAWARQTYDTLDATEEQQAVLQVRTARWP